MSSVDYSKWDHIEISDDEDDTHPNVDTPSLFRWRHQARLDRMEETKHKREMLQEEKKKLEEVREKMSKQTLDDDDEQAKAKLEELKKQEEEWKRKEEELIEKEKSEPWNVDTICHEGFSKSIINKKEKEEGQPGVTDLKRQQDYIEKYEKELRTYGMMRKIDDSQKYLQDHPHLITEKTANYLVIWCIDLELEEKHSFMETVAHQTIILQFILELAKSLRQDPRNCFISFFQKFKKADAAYTGGFLDELNAFKLRVKERARVRIQKAIEDMEREEREKRLGPGGLDPQEVLESLPRNMQECFKSRNIQLLQEIIAKMDPEEAKLHMKRCVASGLWLPQGPVKYRSSTKDEVKEEEKTDEEIKYEQTLE